MNLKHFGRQAALALAMMGSLSLAHAAAAEPSNPLPTLRLEADARQEVTDDMAWAKVAVEKQGRSQQEAQREMLSTMEQLLSRAKGVKQLQVKTDGYSTVPVYGRDGKSTGWRSRGELRIDSSDHAAVAQTAAELAQLGQLAGAGFYLSTQLRTGVQKALIATAVSEFQEKARATATALGYTGTDIKEVAVGQSGFVPRPMMMMRGAAAYGAEMASSAAAAPVPMEPGKTEVTVTVSGTVNLLK
ncbi:hypothetical protein D3C71_21260 [compost metagenome]